MKYFVLLCFVASLVASQRLGFEVEVPGGAVFLPLKDRSHTPFYKAARFDLGTNDEDLIRLTADDNSEGKVYNVEVITAYSGFPLSDEDRICSAIFHTSNFFAEIDRSCKDRSKACVVDDPKYSAPITIVPTFSSKKTFEVFPQVTVTMEPEKLHQVIFKAIPKMYTFHSDTPTSKQIIMAKIYADEYLKIVNAAKKVLLPNNSPATIGVQLFAFFIIQSMHLLKENSGDQGTLSGMGKSINGHVLMRTNYKQFFNYINAKPSGGLYFKNAAELQKSIVDAYLGEGFELMEPATPIFWKGLQITLKDEIKKAATTPLTLKQFFETFFDNKKEDIFRRTTYKETPAITSHYFESMGAWAMDGKSIGVEFRLYIAKHPHDSMTWKNVISYIYANALAAQTDATVPTNFHFDESYSKVCNGHKKTITNLPPLAKYVPKKPNSAALNSPAKTTTTTTTVMISNPATVKTHSNPKSSSSDHAFTSSQRVNEDDDLFEDEDLFEFDDEDEDL